MLSLKDYKAMVFDCDGVILNSNTVKSDAFFQCALRYGEDIANKFVEYHRNNGGISRYEKFATLRSMAGKHEDFDLASMLESYGKEIKQKLMSCEIATGLGELREATISANWCVASGGDQDELRGLFARRQLSQFFDAGIYGSPTRKTEIARYLIDKQIISYPVLMLGDSRLDYEVASTWGFDFVFISGWTECQDWQAMAEEQNLNSVNSIADLL